VSEGLSCSNRGCSERCRWWLLGPVGDSLGVACFLHAAAAGPCARQPGQDCGRAARRPGHARPGHCLAGKCPPCPLSRRAAPKLQPRAVDSCCARMTLCGQNAAQCGLAPAHLLQVLRLFAACLHEFVLVTELSPLLLN
jgi:hypothetical protein